ncbi:MAG: EF-hand domain-containing protein [Sphingomicrobium sp.]
MTKYLLGGAMAAAVVAMAPAAAQMAPPAQVAPHGQTHAWQGRAKVQTRGEVAAHVRTMFDRVDANRDGSLSKAEAEAAKGKRGQWAGRRMHRGGAGGQRANPDAAFERMDANRDGAVSRAEFDASHAQRQQKMAARDHNGDGRPDGRRMGKGHRMGGIGGMGGHMFEFADGNRDGRVTLQEATNAALRHFDTADVNRDGQLTPQERMQMHQRMRSERKPG